MLFYGTESLLMTLISKEKNENTYAQTEEKVLRGSTI